MKSSKYTSNLPVESLLYPLLFFFGRIILIMALLPFNLQGFGDLPVYYGWAENFNWAFIDYWSEYPPLFPWLNELIFNLCRGDYYMFLGVSAICFSLAGALLLLTHSLLSHRLYPMREANLRDLVFFGVISLLPYSWWYFDLIPVLCMMLGLQFLIETKAVHSGFVIALGILSKWYPLFVLVAAARCLPRKLALRTSLIALGSVLVILVSLYFVSPEMTGASFRALSGRHSYQTIWALIDGNMTTGDVFLREEHGDANTAALETQRGNPPVIPAWATLLVFGGLGLISIWKVEKKSERDLINITGITLCIFFMWCPGWSPQWLLFILPLITLSFTWNQALFLASAITLLTVLEWPVLLTRRVFFSLFLLAPLRMVLFSFMTFHWVKSLRGNTRVEKIPVPEEGLSK